MAGFYTARSRTIPPLPWPSFAPPFSASGLVFFAPDRVWNSDDVALPNLVQPHVTEFRENEILQRLPVLMNVLTAEDLHDVNSLLDWIEREDTSDFLPHCPDTVPGTTSYRPRVSVTMAVLRLARTFATPEEFRNALATRGDVNVLSGVEIGQEDLMTRSLNAVTMLILLPKIGTLRCLTRHGHRH